MLLLLFTAFLQQVERANNLIVLHSGLTSITQLAYLSSPSSAEAAAATECPDLGNQQVRPKSPYPLHSLFALTGSPLTNSSAALELDRTPIHL